MVSAAIRTLGVENYSWIRHTRLVVNAPYKFSDALDTVNGIGSVDKIVRMNVDNISPRHALLGNIVFGVSVELNPEACPFSPNK